KVRLGPGALPAYDVVRMATADGAEALGIPAGTIEVGKRADFVLLDPSAGFAEPTGWRDDPYGPIVYAFDRSNVVATYVDGIARFHRSGGGRAGSLRPTSDEIAGAVERLRGRRKELADA